MEYRFFHHPQDEVDPDVLKRGLTCSFDVEEYKFNNMTIMILDGSEILIDGDYVGDRLNNHVVAANLISKDEIGYVKELDLYYIVNGDWSCYPGRKDC